MAVAAAAGGFKIKRRQYMLSKQYIGMGQKSHGHHAGGGPITALGIVVVLSGTLRKHFKVRACQ